MPELPDITMYIEALERKVQGRKVEDVRIRSPFLLRSVEPPISAIVGKEIIRFRRLGKRIVFEFESETEPLFMVIHLMIAGRLRWQKRGAKLSAKNGLAAFDFDDGSLVFTEASTKKRASIYMVTGDGDLDEHDRGGIDVMNSSLEEFKTAMTERNHTLKRALTDQRILSGIGNAYSDEILFEARISPFKQTKSIDDEIWKRLHDATLKVLDEWTVRFREELGEKFPDKVTAFRDEMNVHGKYKQPCNVCSKPIQRIRYASNESNYCANCQTAGKLLADRSLSRLLKKDWPKTLEDLEQHFASKKLPTAVDKDE